MGRRAPAVFPHQGLDSRRHAAAAPEPLGPQRRRLEHGQRRPRRVDRPFEQHSVPGYREIIDLSPANDSRFHDAVGQSGHPCRSHYDDFLQDWRAVKHRKMRMERSDIERGALGTLRLAPRN